MRHMIGFVNSPIEFKEEQGSGKPNNVARSVAFSFHFSLYFLLKIPYPVSVEKQTGSLVQCFQLLSPNSVSGLVESPGY